MSNKQVVIIQRKRLRNSVASVAEKVSKNTSNLVPFYALMFSTAVLVVFRTSPLARKTFGNVAENSRGQINSLNFVWSPVNLLTMFLAGLALYLWIDYQKHRRPLHDVSPGTKYGLLHHLRVVNMAKLNYRWKPAVVWMAATQLCIGLFIATVLVIGFPSVSAFSGSGLGTSGNPYIITSCQQLQEMRDDRAGHYELAGPIDCTDTVNWNSGTGFVPIASNSEQFTGTLDGKGFTIDGLNQLITVGGTDDFLTGIFGKVTGGTLANFSLTNASFRASDTGQYVAAIAGILSNTSVSDVSVSGEIVVNTNAESSIIGGIADMASLSNFTRISTNLNITHNVLAPDNDKPSLSGGLFGALIYSTLTDSYTKGTITGHVGGSGNDGVLVGGLAGQVQKGILQNSYSSMDLNIDKAGELQGSVAIMGGLSAVLSGTEVNNNIATGAQSMSGDFSHMHQGTISGAIIYLPGDENFGTNASGTDNYVDASRIGLGSCIGTYLDDNFSVSYGTSQMPSDFCTVVNAGNSQPNYLFNNSTNPPYKVSGTQVWDFTDVWRIQNNSLPIFKRQVPPEPTIPGKVRNITSSSSNSTSFTAEWTVPLSNGNSPITNYAVQYKLHSASSWSNVPRTASTTPNQLVTGLSSGVLYDIRIAAINGIGQGDWEVIQNVSTSQVPSIPQNFVVTGLLQDHIRPYLPKLDWQEPTYGTPVTDYVIQYKLHSSNSWATLDDGVSSVPGFSTDEEMLTDTNNTYGQLIAAHYIDDTFDFRVAAVNSFGQGAWSTSQNFQVYIGITDCGNLHEILMAEVTNGLLFKIENDIDCSETADWNNGLGWDPIRTEVTPFEGILDGGNFTISGLTINNDQDQNLSMIKYANNATFKNLRFSGVNYRSWGSELTTVATLVGLATGSTTFDNISVSGSLTGTGQTGGLVGTVSAEEGKTINFSNIDFDGSILSGYAGGIVGSMDTPGGNYIFNDVHTSGTLDSQYFSGGILGLTNDYVGNKDQLVNITDSGSIMDISTSCIYSAGGLIGFISAGTTITNSTYSGNIGCDDKNYGFLESPRAVAFDSLGNSYVTNTGSTIENWPSIKTFSDTGQPQSKWYTNRPGDSSENSAVIEGIVIDSTGKIYVADTLNSQVRIYQNGNFVSSWATPSPGQMAIDSTDHIFIVSGFEIRKYNTDGTLLNTWGEEGTGPGQFVNLQDIALAPDGRIFVSDLHCNNVETTGCVHVLDSAGNQLADIDNAAAAHPKLIQPGGLAFVNNQLFVLDGNRKEVVVFDNSYNFVNFWGQTGVGNAPIVGTDLVSRPDGTVVVLGGNNENSGSEFREGITQYQADGTVVKHYGISVESSYGSWGNIVGGLVGLHMGTGLYVDNCATSGRITSPGGGGLVGASAPTVDTNVNITPELYQGMIVSVQNSSSAMDLVTSWDESVLTTAYGGLIGNAGTSLLINNSESTGDISITGHVVDNVNTTLFAVGGIAGATPLMSTAQINNVTTSGSITASLDTSGVTNPPPFFVGGVVGLQLWSGITMNEVHSSRPISITSSNDCQQDCTSTFVSAGGLIGNAFTGTFLNDPVNNPTLDSSYSSSSSSGNISINGPHLSIMSGGLFGTVWTNSRMDLLNSFSTGNVISNENYTDKVGSGATLGGLVGMVWSINSTSPSSVQNSYATGSVLNYSQSPFELSNFQVPGVLSSGGLAGAMWGGNFSFSKVYASGDVYGIGGVAGLIGYAGRVAFPYTDQHVGDFRITDAYASGSVTAKKGTVQVDSGYIEMGSVVGGLLGYASDIKIQNSYASGQLSNEEPVFADTVPIAYREFYASASTGGLVGYLTMPNYADTNVFTHISNSFSAADFQDSTSVHSKGAFIGRIGYAVQDGYDQNLPGLNVNNLLTNNYYDSTRGGDLPCANRQVLVFFDNNPGPDLDPTYEASIHDNQTNCKKVNEANSNPNIFRNSTTIPPLDTWDFSTPIWYKHVANYPNFLPGESIPGPPRNLSGAPTTSSVALSWDPPSSDGGSAVTNYRVQYKLHGTDAWTEFSHPESTATSYTISGLTSGKEYDFQVAAINAVGQSSWALGSYTVLSVNTPTTPTNPSTPTTPANPTTPTRPGTPRTTTNTTTNTTTQDTPPLLDISKVSPEEFSLAIPSFTTRPKKVSIVPYFFISWLLLLALYFAFRAWREYRYQIAMKNLILQVTNTKKAISEFLAITSHYLNTPLSILKGAIELIASKHSLQADFVQQFQLKLNALQATASLLTSNAEQAEMSASNAVVVGEVKAKANHKQLWISLIVISVAIAVSDVVLYFSKSYDHSWGRLLNHLMWAVFGLVAIGISYYAWLKQREYHSLSKQQLLAERNLLTQKNNFLADASIRLEAHTRELAAGTQGLEQFPDTRLLTNGLGMLRMVASAFTQVQHFAVINPAAPNLSVRDTYETSIAPELQSLMTEKAVTVTNSFQPDAVVQLQSDELGQILKTTIENAIQFSKPNGRVQLSTRTGNSKTEIIVQDFGIGMAPEVQAHLFEPLTRGTDTATFDHPGLGLNLFITRMILQKHNGKIRVDSMPDQGTKVTISIPRSHADPTGHAVQVITPVSA